MYFCLLTIHPYFDRFRENGASILSQAKSSGIIAMYVLEGS